MNAVVNLREFALRKSDVLVLVDLHEEVDGIQQRRVATAGHALTACRLALSHARRRGSPVAFVRRRVGPRVPAWQAGIALTREDMLFERQAHSCYASEPFSAMVEAAGGRFMLAGLFGETSCIATMIDAANRGHRVTLLRDASCSGALGEFSAVDAHRAIVAILEHHGAVISTHEWMGGSLASSARET